MGRVYGRVLEATEKAKRDNLKVGVGLQRHHHPQYLETVRRLHDGAIGDIVACASTGTRRESGCASANRNMTEMEYQMRNWYYFNWLCGDHIVEQHIHNHRRG